MDLPLRHWLRIAFFNLLLVAFIGIILRYKIAFSLPFVDQKFLLHGHSHFAFAGWLTQILMALMVAWLGRNGVPDAFKRYRVLLYANLFTAYGMLLTFPFQGYGLYSIIFSTLSIAVSFVFAVGFWQQLNRLPQRTAVHGWFKAAIFFNAFSSAGVFGLAWMMVGRHVHPNTYLASIYFYLHFQYNGWFFFACMGLLCAKLAGYGADEKVLRRVFYLFAGACVPAYFLSALWLPLPFWVYSLVVASVLLQLAGWWLLVAETKKIYPVIRQQVGLFPIRLAGLSAIALTIKLLLQAGSVIPQLSQLAFGFRPIVIGYLHLVLLGILSIFIVAYTVAMGYAGAGRLTRNGILIFVFGILGNETLLMIQGMADLGYTGIRGINEWLLLAAVLLFCGIAVINLGLRDKTAGAGS